MVRKTFKKRKFLVTKKKTSLNFFKVGLQSRSFFKKLKRTCRKFNKRRKICLYINIKASYYVSFKGKNPRMGKGGGSFSRFDYYQKQNKVLVRFKNVNPLRVRRLSTLSRPNLL